MSVTTQGTKALANTEEFDDLFAGESVDTKDFIIPKILLMHPTSELVKKGEKNIGEIMKSTGEVIAKRNETFEVVVIEKWKDWRIMKKNPQSGRFEFEGYQEWTPANDDAMWEYIENGESYRRDKTLNFYALLVSEIGKGKTAYPVKLSFTRTSFRVGGVMADWYAKALTDKIFPWAQTFKIGAQLKEGKEESFFAFTAVSGGAASPEVQETAKFWKKIMKSTGMKDLRAKEHGDDEGEGTSTSGDQTEF